jgi:hypothetical protein
MTDIKRWLKELRDRGTHVREENSSTCDLRYTVTQLENALLDEPNGRYYFQQLAIAGPDLERKGVCTTYKKGGMLYITIPSWVRFMRALQDWVARRQEQVEWCQRRTQSGNVYPQEKDAKIACEILAESGDKLTYYKCFQCQKYHLKKDRK